MNGGYRTSKLAALSAKEGIIVFYLRFGKVYLARTRRTKFIVALKVISKKNILLNGYQEQLGR
jgi:hypothetical protein